MTVAGHTPNASQSRSVFSSIKLLTVRGIPIRAHFTLVVLLPWLAMRYSNLIEVSWLWGALTVVGLFTSIALHELGHAFTGMAKGIRTTEIVLTPIGGIARLARIPPGGRDEFHIAIAGPLVSIGLGLALWLVYHTLGILLSPSLATVLFVLAFSNIALAIFNLIPCFPMDGGRVFRAAMTRRWGRLEATRRAVALGGWFAAALFIWGLLSLNIFLMLIAWFVHSSARAELRNVEMQETARRMDPFEAFFRSPPPIPENEIEIQVGPPPYRRD